MNAAWGWNPDIIKKALSEPRKKYKYFLTDDKEEFLARLEAIAIRGLQNTKDNLKYLEQMDCIRRVREGEDIYEVFPWLEKDR